MIGFFSSFFIVSFFGSLLIFFCSFWAFSEADLFWLKINLKKINAKQRSRNAAIKYWIVILFLKPSSYISLLLLSFKEFSISNAGLPDPANIPKIVNNIVPERNK